ncbi:MAG: NUDIX hydrolase [Oscillospiraceae bacterium]|nr:NUDIX hydrolase [Oscillospiraceae bacterium]
MELKETRLDGKTIYKGQVITVQKDLVKLVDGSTSYREVVRHPGGCCVAAIDGDLNLIMVRQFRYAYNKPVLEIPAGKLDKLNETPFEAAKRELSEETGYEAKNWIDLGMIYPTPGYCDENLYMFAATDIKKVCNIHTDEGEFLTVEKLPFDEIVNKIISDEIKDSKTVSAVLKIKILMLQGKIVI